MRCCGYSLTQSPVRIGLAVATAAVTTGLALKTGALAYEVFSGCASSEVWYDFLATSTAGCEQQITDAFSTGAYTLIAAIATVTLSLTKHQVKEPVQVPNQAELNKLIQDIVNTPKGEPQDKQDSLVRKPRSLSVGSTTLKLAHSVNPPSPDAALRADINAAYPGNADS